MFEAEILSKLIALEHDVNKLKTLDSSSGGVTDHGALTGLSDNDHPQYLLTTGKAADADKLNGQLASYYALATHNHDGTYIPLTNFAGSNATIVGWSGTPAKQITYVVVGKILLMSVYIQGTSNATTARINLPTDITGATHGISQLQPCRVVNNGTLATTPGIAILPNAGTYIDVYTNYAAAGWTSTGTKQVSGNFVWIIA